MASGRSSFQPRSHRSVKRVGKGKHNNLAIYDQLLEALARSGALATKRWGLNEHTTIQTPPSSTSVYGINLAHLNRQKFSTNEFIRLLRPSIRDDGSVACEMQTFTLQPLHPLSAPSYAALSYSWGDSPADQIVHISTSRATDIAALSEDLSAALANVSRVNSSGWPWVDALCINQASNAEKSDQVKKMKTIYGRANVVFVWLGADVSDDDLTMILARHEQAGLSLRIVNDLSNRALKVWCRRSWVVQEVASCETVKVCIGSHVTDWRYFVDLFCAEETNVLIAQDFRRVEPETVRNLAQAQDEFTTLARLREQIRSNPQGMEIAPLLRSTISTSVSHPLDRVYSLLGLANDAVREEIKVRYRYGSAVVELWQDVVQCHLKTTSNLDILFDQWPRGRGVNVLTTRQREDDGSRKSGPSLKFVHSTTTSSMPSWMPDFWKPLQTEQPRMPIALYSASGSEPVAFSVEGPILRIEAFKCDVVSHIGIPPEKRSGTLLAGNRAHNMLVASKVERWAQEIQKLPVHPFVTQPRDRQALRSDLSHWPARDLEALRSFYTRSGLVGWTHHELQPGDKVIIPYGSKVAVAVRSENALKSKYEHVLKPWWPQHGCYNLVGECHIPGWMHGEVLALYNDGEVSSQMYTLV
ncbi:hypothetical protein LTR09_009801 [Extremus antarcticus]|uniref:Heterokaryon incompatibility domain-containing protein n=1 Tax=Extremus antarcticus TaxID=702011 RepID=A0AAJ0D8J7_9PEZI|nr:hypothetical protein LTR09_009801 [Extremus antarcticus]